MKDSLPACVAGATEESLPACVAGAVGESPSARVAGAVEGSPPAGGVAAVWGRMAATDPAIKRLRYRSWRRGTREMDLLLGRFADATLEGCDEGQLRRFAALLERPDPDLGAWILGEGPVPEAHRSDMLDRLRAFHRRGRRP